MKLAAYVLSAGNKNQMRRFVGVVVSLEEGARKDTSLEPLMALVADDMDRVNAVILSMARSDVEMIPELAGHLINSGGKRLRPVLTIAAAQMCG